MSGYGKALAGDRIIMHLGPGHMENLFGLFCLDKPRFKCFHDGNLKTFVVFLKAICFILYENVGKHGSLGKKAQRSYQCDKAPMVRQCTFVIVAKIERFMRIVELISPQTKYALN